MARKEILESLIIEVAGKEKDEPRNRHGKRIREIRKQQGLTQEELVEKLEIDIKTLSKIENGDGILRGEAAIKLYLEYGYSLDWVYGISDVQDEKSPYLVDIRDVIHINDGGVHVVLKKYLYELLKLISNEAPSIKVHDLDDSYVSFSKGIAKQRRRLVYFNNNSECYCVSVPEEQFELRK